MTQTRHLMQPIAAVTPPRHMAHLVASRSYLSYQKDELLDKLKHNPYSYIQVINPDASGEVLAPRGTSAFFREVRKGYDAFKERGWLQDAPGEEWIVYRQSTEDHSWTGVVCNLDLNLCAKGRLPHLPGRSMMSSPYCRRAHHMHRCCDGSVLGIYLPHLGGSNYASIVLMTVRG